MEIGGIDIQFETERLISLSEIENVIRSFWPNCIAENATNRQDYQELFVYQDANAVKNWESDVSPIINDMIYVISEPKHLTLVIDERTPEIEPILNKIEQLR